MGNPKAMCSAWFDNEQVCYCHRWEQALTFVMRLGADSTASGFLPEILRQILQSGGFV